MGPRKCAVCQCSRLGTIFRVPSNPERAEKFLQFIGKEEFYHWSLDKLHAQVGVCERHFEERFISRSGRKTLLIAVGFPTLNPSSHNPSGANCSGSCPQAVCPSSCSSRSQAPVYGSPASQPTTIGDPLHSGRAPLSRHAPFAPATQVSKPNDPQPLVEECALQPFGPDDFPEHRPSTSTAQIPLASQSNDLGFCTPDKRQLLLTPHNNGQVANTNPPELLTQSDELGVCTPTKHQLLLTPQDNGQVARTDLPEPLAPHPIEQDFLTPMNVAPTSTSSTPRHYAPRSQSKARKRLPILSSLGIGRKALTPRKSTPLYRKLQKSVHAAKKLAKKLAIAKRRIRQLQHEQGKPNSKGLSHALRLLVEGEKRNRQRHLKGRRWSREEKMLAVSLMKRGPKLYRHLSKIMTLPSKKVLNNFLREIPFPPGLLTPMLSVLSKKAVTMPDPEKLCVIMFDEMAIQESISYLPHEDRIAGFQEVGPSSSKLVANHAMVFMVRSLCGAWKLPIAYYYVKDGLDAPTYASLIRACCTELSQIGLIPIATVCDQGSSNVGAVNYLQQSCENPGPYFEFDV